MTTEQTNGVDVVARDERWEGWAVAITTELPGMTFGFMGKVVQHHADGSVELAEAIGFKSMLQQSQDGQLTRRMQGEPMLFTFGLRTARVRALAVLPLDASSELDGKGWADIVRQADDMRAAMVPGTPLIHRPNVPIIQPPNRRG